MKKVLISILAFAVVLLSCGIHGDEIIYSSTLFEHGLSSLKISHGDIERSFEIFIPRTYDGIKKHALVFVLHGGGGNSKSAQKMSDFSELAEKEGFICVFPNGSGMLQDKLLTWNSGNCCGYAYENNIDDVDFIDSTIDFLCEKLLIKKDMIFACGLSNGGMMSFRLACELSEKIAAVGIVAGALNIDSEPILPVSVIQLHGTSDNHVLYEGGIGSEQVGKGDRVDRPVSFARDFWVNQNGCSDVPSTKVINETTIDSYFGGRLGTEYKLYTIEGFGHAWPGGAKNRDTADETDCSISATEEIWNFFKTHPKQSNRLEEVDNWAYQLQDLWDEKIDALAESEYDMVVVDRNGSIKGEDEDYNDGNDVEIIRAEKDDRLVICYIDVGQAESYRKYWQDDWQVGKPGWILTEDPDGWDENFLVKFWQQEWLDIMLEQFDVLVSAGYDGAFLDWLEIYNDPSVIDAAKEDGVDPKEELIKFVRTLTSHARKQNPEFIIIAQNASALGADRNYRNLFDGIAQEAIWFDGSGDPDDSNIEADIPTDPELTKEYIKNLRIWQFFGFPVFNCEYADKKASVAFDLGMKHGFKTYCARRPLEEISRTPPSFEQHFRCENLIHVMSFDHFISFVRTNR
ncbi:MAG: endo alpha-1,4 polygalactosaminidase [Caldisericia bacterium]